MNLPQKLSAFIPATSLQFPTCYKIWKLLLRAFLHSCSPFFIRVYCFTSKRFPSTSAVPYCSWLAISLSSCCTFSWLIPFQQDSHSSKCYITVKQILRKRIILNPWCWRLKIRLTSNLFSFGFLRQNNFSADFLDSIFDSVANGTFSKAFSHGANDI